MVGPSEGKDPNSYDEVLQSENKDQWLNAINEELKSLKENCTWELVERPKGVKMVEKWMGSSPENYRKRGSPFQGSTGGQRIRTKAGNRL